MYIDLKNAEKEFKKYVSDYDFKNERIKLKVKHTLKVKQVSKKVAKSLNLSQEDVELAELIGLLHDIGRFEQVKQYNTFADRKSVNHGELGVKILFEENLIRKFVPDNKYDEIIKIAILNHNKKSIEEGLSERQLMFCKIIRDADKLDIFRVLLENSTQAIYGCDSKKMENEEVSEEIYKNFFEEKLIDYSAKKTNPDNVVCHLAYVFDIYYPYSLEVIRNKKYIQKLINRVKFKNKKAIEQMKAIETEILSYLNKG